MEQFKDKVILHNCEKTEYKQRKLVLEAKDESSLTRALIVVKLFMATIITEANRNIPCRHGTSCEKKDAVCEYNHQA